MSQIHIDLIEEKLLEILNEAHKSLEYQCKVFPSNRFVDQSKQHTKKIIEDLARVTTNIGKLRPLIEK